MRKHNMNRFLFMGNTTLTRPSTLNLTAGRGLSFFSQIERKYRVRHSFEKFTLYFLHLANQPDTPIVEHRFVFKPVFRWTLLNRVENYFPTLKWTTQTSMSPGNRIERLNTSFLTYLTRSLSPELTRFLTQLLTRSFSRSTSFTFTSLLHERKSEKSEKGITRETRETREREREREYTTLIHHSPDTAAERIRADIFKWAAPTPLDAPPSASSVPPGQPAYYLNKCLEAITRITSQSNAQTINRLITPSLSRSLTPALTRSLTQLLTRSFSRSSSFTFTSLLHERKREIKGERERERIIRERERERPIEIGIDPTTGKETRNWETANYTYLIHQTPYTADIADIAETAVERVERIRTDIFNYFSTFGRITSQSATAAINRMITTSLTRSLTPSLTQSLTQLLNRSFNLSTSFTTLTTLLHTEKRETKSERVIPYTADIADIAHTSVERVERIRAGIFKWAAPTPLDAPPSASSIPPGQPAYYLNKYLEAITKITSQSSAETINRMITTSLSRSLTPALTQSLSQLLNRSFSRSTTFTTPPPVPGTGTQFTFPITGTISGVSTAGTDYTTLIYQRPYTADIAETADIAYTSVERVERIQADIFNYFATFSRMTSQSASETINRMITTSLLRSLTPTLTQSLNQLLNRSFNRSTTFTTPPPVPGTGTQFTFPITTTISGVSTAGTDYTTLIHQTPYTIDGTDIAEAAVKGGERIERIRADIFNYFTTFSRMTSQSAAETINRMITTSLSPSLTPALTQSLTQLLNRSFNRSTSFTTFTTLLREEKRETKNERVIRDREKERPIEIGWETTDYTYLTHKIPHSADSAAERGERRERGKRTRADIANYFAVFNRMTSQSAAETINRMITTSLAPSLTPALTQSLTQLLNRSFNRSTSFTTFTTLLREEKRETKNERVIRDRERERPIEIGWETTDYTYLTHKIPHSAD
ncbi:MAG: hypothetical protein GY950_35255, partial [bacterium]|nr:hypothetical protein [bacterium]